MYNEIRQVKVSWQSVSEYSKQINKILSLLFVYIQCNKYSTATSSTTSLSVAMEIGGMWWGWAAVSGRLIALAAFYLPTLHVLLVSVSPATF